VTTGPDADQVDLSFSFVDEAGAPPGIDGDHLESLAAFVLVTEGATGAWEITVALVSDARLQALHRDFMGIDTPTDIMTFPSDESDGEDQGGELVISVDHALSQATAWGLSPDDEIRFLVSHGLLHLLGWHDESDEQRQRMLQRQQQLVDRWRQTRTRNRG
jgi:probable rRNA maturation factor